MYRIFEVGLLALRIPPQMGSGSSYTLPTILLCFQRSKNSIQKTFVELLQHLRHYAKYFEMVV